MLLGIDVGNTNITFGIFNDKVLVESFRIMTNTLITSDELGIRIKTITDSKGFLQFDDVIISSVVPSIMDSLVNGIKKYLKVDPIVLKNNMDFGIKLNVDHPNEVGMDRIVDLVGAKELYKAPCIVVDFGTATTYDLLDEDNVFSAGITAPGIMTSLMGLVSKAAMLTNIEIELPKSILAKNTKDSMNAGLLYGQIGQLEYIVKKIKEESCISDLKVIITGGLGALMTKSIDIDTTYNENLTLYGLKSIYDRLKNEDSR